MESLPCSSEERPISERTRSRSRRDAETTEQTASRLSAQRDRDRCRRSNESLEHTERRRAADRCRSQHRRVTESTLETAERLSARRHRDRRQRSCETVEQADRRRAADRSRSQRRRVLETPDETAARLSAQRDRRSRQPRKSVDSFEAALTDVDSASCVTRLCETFIVHSCGTISEKCQRCQALFFPSERLSQSSSSSPKFGLCCGDGKVKLWTVPDPPKPLVDWLTDNSTQCRQFRRDIRKYNCALCLASLQANEITFSSGPSVFKVQGEVYRFIGPLRQAEGQEPKCMQTFFVDSSMQADIGNRRFGATDINIMKDLRAMLDSCNSYVRSFVTIDEQLQSGLLPQSVSLELLADRQPSTEHRGRYNVPTSNEEVAILMTGDTSARRSIVVQPRARDEGAAGLQLIPETHRSWDPLHYVLMFPYGTDGFHLDIQNQTGQKCTSAMEYYCYRLMQRPGLNVIQRCGRLFQQYVVDACAKIEQSRLNYLRFNQNNLRSDIYSGVADAVLANDGDRAGRRIVLPASFTGGARHMHRLFQDAMAIVRRYGKPHLFITFTCNVQWAEIQSSLFEGQTANDRPDIVSRVFRLKLNDFIQDIVKNHIFGSVLAYVQTIEFQKRGLPHAHMLFILSGRQHCWQEVDRLVCAELPDQSVHPQLFDVVTSCMLHVCGPGSACFKDGKCSKNFPKPFRRQTSMGDDSYPLYRRRSPEDGGKTFNKYVRGQATVIDNRYVVPYNAYLLLRYNAHINVEYCASIKAVKYLYKYIFKGHDRAVVSLSHDKSSLTVDDTVTDEIKNYVDCRFIGAMEAVWRIFHFPLHDRHPAVQPLEVHLKHQQRVIFADGQADAVVAKGEPQTTLTEFYRTNATDDNAKRYFYHEFPEHFTWNRSSKRWCQRKRGRGCTIGRMYTIHPNQGEIYYLRLMLLHVRGAVSFTALRTVNGRVCETFKDACSQLNLLEDDAEWRECLSDAAQCQMPFQLRTLFVSLLLFCEPADPLRLFEQFAEHMAEDFKRSQSDCMQHTVSRNMLLLTLEKLLAVHDRQLSQFNLPAAAENLPMTDMCDEQQDAGAADYLAANKPLLNDDQRRVYDAVCGAVDSTIGGMFFLDAPGGTGKTFLLNCILAYVRQRNDVALAVAGSGIAATLLKLGRTAHSRFKLPIPVDENSTCNVTPRSATAELFRHTKLIVWDEAPMSHRHLFDALDRTLRDIINTDKLFGGIPVLLAGDFRQILPVVRLGRRADIVDAALSRSALWQQCVVLQLHRNMRVEKCNQDEQQSTQLREYADWLLQLGDGKLPIVSDGSIQLPEELCVSSVDDLVEFVFGELPPHHDNAAWVSSRAILCPRNQMVDNMNDRILAMFPGDTVTCFSVDTVAEVDQQAIYPSEYLNSLTLSGLPPHKLSIKIGAPIMLLRNMAPSRGHCNGTRYIVRQISRRYITAEIACGEYSGNVLFIPRIPLSPTDAGLPFTLRRRQFPVRPAFAMTINKAQGQTLDRVGVLLEEPVFSHGQLYVASSRCGDPRNIKFCVERKQTINVVYTEVLSK